MKLNEAIEKVMAMFRTGCIAEIIGVNDSWFQSKCNESKYSPIIQKNIDDFMCAMYKIKDMLPELYVIEGDTKQEVRLKIWKLTRLVKPACIAELCGKTTNWLSQRASQSHNQGSFNPQYYPIFNKVIDDAIALIDSLEVEL